VTATPPTENTTTDNQLAEHEQPDQQEQISDCETHNSNESSLLEHSNLMQTQLPPIRKLVSDPIPNLSHKRFFRNTSSFAEKCAKGTYNPNINNQLGI
jgi:hypothetical protein